MVCLDVSAVRRVRYPCGDDQWDIVKCLIEHGVDAKSQAGADALSGASRDGQWDVVKCLIEHGVDPKSLAGADALVYASAQCRWDLVKWLVELGVRRHVPWAVCRRRASKQQHPSVISNRGGGG